VRATTVACAALALSLAACATPTRSGWTTLIDGTRGLDNFTRVAEANWSAKDGAIEVSAGGKEYAYLVSKDSYRDFSIRVEFWASDDANTGVYFRCQDRANPTDENCYEANVFDQRPDQTYGTGALTKVAAVAQPAPKVGGQWSVYEITAMGPQITLVLNGMKTIDTRDSKFASGPIALQWARGTAKFRKVEIKPL